MNFDLISAFAKLFSIKWKLKVGAELSGSGDISGCKFEFDCKLNLEIENQFKWKGGPDIPLFSFFADCSTTIQGNECKIPLIKIKFGLSNLPEKSRYLENEKYFDSYYVSVPQKELEIFKDKNEKAREEFVDEICNKIIAEFIGKWRTKV